MHSRIKLFAALTLLAALIVALPLSGLAQIRSTKPAQKVGVPVDVELVLAVDISYSMDPEEQALQREGYIKALTSREFLQALRAGINGRIAVTYFEWAGYTERRVVVPWRLVEGPESADAFVSEIAAAPYRRAARTSISGAIEFGTQLFEDSGYSGLRRVIDISGDGANNHGQLVTVARDATVAKGITINGLPIVAKRLNYATMDIEKLDIYYEDCVIGGPGAFVIPIESRDKFVEATKTKLVLEIAGRVPEARIIPVSADKPRVSCTVGERLWQERWGN
jgi:hypothetical protein